MTEQRRAERVSAEGAFLSAKGTKLALADFSTMGARTQASLPRVGEGDSLIVTLTLPGRTAKAKPAEFVVPAMVVANGERGLIVRYSALEPKAATAIEKFLARKA
jgi:hypothetical protein